MMAAFLSKLIVEDDGGAFVLAAPLAYQSAVLGGVLTVPIGFPTDFASIPRLLWNILPPIGKYDAGAVCHDRLYREGTFNGQAISRGAADRVLREAMGCCGVNAFYRHAIYAGVRVGGWLTWRRCRAAALPAESL